MNNLTNFWQLPPNEQQQFQQSRATHDPAQYTLSEVYNTDIEYELAMCASGLFIMIVQDRGDLGGGYGIQALALGKYIHKHVETFEEVEPYLVAKCPYKTGAAVWTPLANYRSFMDEIGILKSLEG